MCRHLEDIEGLDDCRDGESATICTCVHGLAWTWNLSLECEIF